MAYSASSPGSDTARRVIAASCPARIGAGVKLRDGGSVKKTMAAQASPRAAMAASAPRHPAAPATALVTRRPVSPPRAVPPMYRPAARAYVPGCVSSRR
jgi:hypothetical protein